MKKLCPLIFAFTLLTAPLVQAAEQETSYLIGRGMADVTGPAVGMQMWGFGRTDQITEGIHIRQRSRAFIVAQADRPEQRLVFVSVDLGSIEHHITLEVLDRLREHFGGTYTLNNVIVSATHTHAGPGGYWHSRNEQGFDGGFYPAHFEAIVAGITRSIVKAHNDLQPGGILIASGTVANAGANRSLNAYRENPQAERDRYGENTDTRMTLLKFVGASGPIGALNWFALHPTAMNFYNRLISGDHKGYASLAMEKKYGAGYNSGDDFVAAFAQSTPGDVTPNMNLDNTGPGDTDVDTTRILGDRQLQVALQLFDQAREDLRGPVDSRQVYVNLSNYEVQDQFTRAGMQHTCPSAYGYSFAGGSTEDGGGHFLFEEGMTEQSFFLDVLIRLVTGAPKWTEAVKNCQSPKPILFETGSSTPPLQSQIRSITLARIGQLVIVGLPAEVTTMAARRIRETVMNNLGSWAKNVVLAGYSNGYAGYVTTREEYMLQQYEAAHNLHGPWALPAYQQIVSQLGRALETDSAVESNAAYDDWRGQSAEAELHTGETLQFPEGKKAGDVLPLSNTHYQPGDIAIAEFWSSNPSRHYVTGNNFLLLERKTQASWQALATDSDWSTRVRWRGEARAFVAELSWVIPVDAKTGEYRFTHFGEHQSLGPYSGVSNSFYVD
jgi:neutral ceramidase